jgi:hypothetical protein
MIGKRRRLVQIASDDSEDEFVPGEDDTKDEDMKQDEFIPEFEEFDDVDFDAVEEEALKNKSKAKPVMNPFKSTPAPKPSSSSTLSPVVSRFKNISVSKPAQNPFSQLTSKQEQRKVGKDKVNVSIK